MVNYPGRVRPVQNYCINRKDGKYAVVMISAASVRQAWRRYKEKYPSRSRDRKAYIIL